MLKCPNCELEIDHIECVTTEYFRAIVRLPKDEAEKLDTDYDPDSGLVYTNITTESPVEDKYVCPHCGKEIAQDEEEVAKFLRGG